jgi:DNA segregation ATPase FtsK/SpoIIIE, S-DNA-T family
MASYQVRQRDPLIDEGTQAMLERRGRELIGLGLIAVAALVFLMLATYSPTDPGWMVASDQPVQNWLGRIGAGLSSTLVIILGRAAWGLPLVLLAWGVRFVTHRGAERASGRMVFALFAIVMGAVFAATYVPGEGWPHAFGLGGLFGDTVLGAALGVTPVKVSMGMKLLSLGSGLATLALYLFVTGFDRAELREIGRFTAVWSVQGYDMALRLAGRGAGSAMQGAAGLKGRLDARRTRPTAGPVMHDSAPIWDEPAPLVATHAVQPLAAPRRQARVQRAEPPLGDESLPLTEAFDAPQAFAPQAFPSQTISAPAQRAPHAPRRKEGFFGLFARTAEPVAMVEPEVEAMPEDRIKARISDAIRARMRQGGLSTPTAQMSPLQAAVARHEPRSRLMRLAEPPLTAPTAAAAPAAPVTAVSAAVAAAARRAASAAPRLPGPAPDMAQPAPAPAPQVAARAMPPLAAAPARAAAPSAAAASDRLAAPPLRRPTQPLAVEPVEDPAAAIRAAAAALKPAAVLAVEAPNPWSARSWEAEVDEDEDADDWQPQREERPALARAFQPAQAERRVVQHPPRKPIQPSARASAEAQPRLRFEDQVAQDYELPPLSLLASPTSIQRHTLSDEALEENARMLESVLDDYGVKGEIVSVRPGPVVTMYELEPAPGLKASRVIGLADDIARSMSALSARVSTVPGRSVIGIELPNVQREKVVLREILAARDFGDTQMRLPLALGKDIGGDPVVANLAKMPHLLIAGTTGSGKSVAINTMILSLLYKLTPEECRLIMIDPKMLELSVYDGIPHLLSPVVTDPKKAVVALKWVVGEMEERYRKMSKMGVRNIEGYNGRVREAQAKGELFKRTIQTGFDEETGDPVFETEEFAPQPFPYIVVIVDEMADLMMVAGKEIEACIQRLAQMARASGIHLIMATQRPSVDVITGTIKANFPTRISFQVTSKIDSRTILGEQGAEQLLGMGDMLYMAGGGRISRIHGPFVSDEEVEEIVNHLKSFGPPSYMSGVVEGPDDEVASDIDAVLGLNTGGNTEGEDALYDQAVAIVAKDRKCSTSYIQRKLGIGYNKAARLVEQMEEQGIVTPANHVGKREILIPET